MASINSRRWHDNTTTEQAVAAVIFDSLAKAGYVGWDKAAEFFSEDGSSLLLDIPTDGPNGVRAFHIKIEEV